MLLVLVLVPSPVPGLLIGLRLVVLVLVVSLAVRGNRVAKVGVIRPVLALVVVGDCSSLLLVSWWTSMGIENYVTYPGHWGW